MIRKSAVFVIAGLVAVPGAAVAANYGAQNTPETGYVMCVNKQSRAVTYPGRLSCPSSAWRIELGAQGEDGLPGPRGDTGPQGPAGPQGQAGGSSNIYFARIPDVDVVADGYITSGTQMVTKVVFAVSANPTTSANNEFVAYLSGIWSESARVGSRVHCFFQSQKDFVGKTGKSWYGGAGVDYASWNVVQLQVRAVVPSRSENDPLLLICRTSGSVKSLSGMLYAQGVGSLDTLTPAPIPTSP